MTRPTTQGRLTEYGATDHLDLDRLTGAEKRAYVACRVNGVGVREHARETDRSPGTISNLLRRADDRLGGKR